MSSSYELPKPITLKNGKIVLLKLADIDDYRNGRYEFLYFWLAKVDTYLSRKYTPEDLEENKQSWLQNFDRNRITIIGVYDDRIIASATLLLSDVRSRTAHIASFGIAIHPEFQNLGLGTTMIETLESIAKKVGVQKIEVNYYAGNPASALYESLHYHYEGRRLKKAKLDDGSVVDEILMYKFI